MDAKQLAELAMEVDMGDPIDFGMIPIKEEDAFLDIAEQVIGIMQSYNPIDRQYVAMAAMTKLLVENFVLNVQLMSQGE